MGRSRSPQRLLGDPPEAGIRRVGKTVVGVQKLTKAIYTYLDVKTRDCILAQQETCSRDSKHTRWVV